ncbi:MAG: hypothetical protein IKX86_00885 [Clostridia bacterium]|nr:hypothetical protein [Clostridia bacterium]MBR5767216.1 hypothetical protein [Clostridia bacterium]
MIKRITILVLAALLLLSSCMLQNSVSNAPSNGENDESGAQSDAQDDTAVTLLQIPDELTDISLVRVGMTIDEVKEALPELSYSGGLPSQNYNVRYYVNDRATGHVFFVTFGDDRKVIDISDSGFDVDYLAPREQVYEKIKSGMTFDEVVAVLGRPLYAPLFGVSSMMWRYGNGEKIVLPFINIYPDPENTAAYYAVVKEFEWDT